VPSPFGPCRHCQRYVFLRPRKLCCPCFKNLAVRALYPTATKHARDHYRDPPPAPEPTTAPPGTRAKLAVLAARVAAKVLLHHPEDAKTLDAADAADVLGQPDKALALSRYDGPRCSRCRHPWDRRDGRKCCPKCRADALICNARHAMRRRRREEVPA
jgi:hypothetical protein